MDNVFCIGNGESRVGFDLESLRPHGKIFGCNAIYRDFLPDVLTAVDHGIIHEIYHSGIAQKIHCYFREWTKVPAHMYESMVHAGLSELEVKEWENQVIESNERGDSKEFVMHGSNIKGVVDLIRRNKDNTTEVHKRNIDKSKIKISWIKEPDYSYSLKDIMVNENAKDGTPKDHGWACGASSGYIAIKTCQPKRLFMIGHDINSTTPKVNNIYKGTRHYVPPEQSPTPGVNWIRQWYQLMYWFPEVEFIKVNRRNDNKDPVNGDIEEWRDRDNMRYIDYSTLDNMLGL